MGTPKDPWAFLDHWSAKPIATVLLLAVFFGLRMAWASWAYQDWSCAFKHCVSVKP